MSKRDWQPPDGSVHGYGDRWYYAIRVPTPGNPRTQLKRGGFTTRDDAEAALEDVRDLLKIPRSRDAARNATLRAELGKDIIERTRNGGRLPDVEEVRDRYRLHLPVVATERTVADFLNSWLDGHARARATTRERLRGIIRTYLVPHLGDVPLDDVQALADRITGMRAWIERRNEVVRRARAAGLPVPPDPLDVRRRPRVIDVASQAQVFNTLRAALNHAVRRRRLLPFNPCDAVELPTVPRRAYTVWERAEVARFLEATRDDRLHAAWWLALHHGPRRGELAGLRWEDVDLDAGLLRIQRQLVYEGREVVETDVKTAAGHRTLRLDPGTVARLRARREVRDLERDFAGAAWSDTGYVFVDELGQPYPPQRWDYRWHLALRAAGARHIRLHDTRHTFATHALRAGVALAVVSEHLGHASIGITQGVYQHVLDEMKETAAPVIGSLYDS